MAVNRMELSAAIRLGAMLKPQAFGDLSVSRSRWWFRLFGPREEATCALGAAFEAAGCVMVERPADGSDSSFRGAPAKAGVTTLIVEHEWPVLHAVECCPECVVPLQMFKLIPHLNDRHRWTRERIAAFVEQVERGYEAAPAVEIATSVP